MVRGGRGDTLSLGVVTPARRVVTYRPRDGKFTARGTVSLPPCRGKFTAAGAVSSYSLENSDESLENSFATLGGNEKVQG